MWAFATIFVSLVAAMTTFVLTGHPWWAVLMVVLMSGAQFKSGGK